MKVIKTSIRIYNNKPIRSIWEEKTNSWYYAAVDIISILTDSKNPKTYWPVFKKRHPQIITNCKQLRLRAFDGKMYVTDVLNENGIDEFIPEQKAETKLYNDVNLEIGNMANSSILINPSTRVPGSNLPPISIITL